MNDYSVALLFEALGTILSNQNKIKKHLGILQNDYEYGYGDDSEQKLISECFDNARDFDETR